MRTHPPTELTVLFAEEFPDGEPTHQAGEFPTLLADGRGREVLGSVPLHSGRDHVDLGCHHAASQERRPSPSREEAHEHE